MNYLDLLFSPKGMIKPQPFAFAVIAIYAVNLFLMTVFDAETMLRASIWPLLGIQLALAWAWYVTHAKRLRDAGKGTTIATTIAVIYALCVFAFAMIVSAAATQASLGNSESKSSIGTIVVVLLLAYAFNTGDFGTLGVLIIAYLVLPFILALLVVIYSIVVGTRRSLAPEPAPVYPAQAQ